MEHSTEFYAVIIGIALLITWSLYSVWCGLLEHRMAWMEEVCNFIRNEFTLLDVDQDGIITKDDLHAFLNDMQYLRGDNYAKYYGKREIARYGVLGNLKKIGRPIGTTSFRRWPFSMLPSRKRYGIKWEDPIRYENELRARINRFK